MAFFVPHDVFKYVLSFKDPRYELVRGGGITPNAQCMPFNSETHIEDARDSWDGNTLMIWNRSALVHHGTGQRPFDPNHITGGIINELISIRWMQLLILCLIRPNAAIRLKDPRLTCGCNVSHASLTL